MTPSFSQHIALVIALAVWPGEFRRAASALPNQAPAAVPESTDGTLAGVDTDANGIRDDIDKQLKTQHGNNPEIFRSLVRIAKNYQSFLMSSAPAPDLQRTNALALECLVATTGSVSNALRLQLQVQGLTLNTDGRRKVFQERDPKGFGVAVPSPQTASKDSCTRLELSNTQ